MLARLSVVYRTAVLAVLCALIVGIPALCVELELLSTEKTGAPGSVVTHVFGVTNNASSAQTYNLSYSAPPGWQILGAPKTLSLQSNEESALFVTITIPSGTPAEVYEISLTATSQANPSDTNFAAGTVAVTPVNEVDLQGPTGSSASPGSVAEYVFVLVNRGNAQDSFAISALSSRGLPLTLSLRAADLAPQERVTFTIQLDIAGDKAPGRDVLTVVAESVLYDSVEADVDVFTTILPPSPETVGGTLMETLPARIRLSIDKNVMTGVFDSQLTFSLSGQVLGGYFSSYFSTIDPLGPSQTSIGSFSMLYRRDPLTYSLGDVSLRVSDLLRTSCRGGAIEIEREFVDIWLIGGGSNDETRFAGRMTLGPERANGGFGYMGIRDPVDVDQSVWSATAFVEPIEDWTMRLEGALGMDSQLTSRALFFNTTIDTSGYFFSSDVYSVGSHFPGQRQDSAGIEVSQRLRLSAIAVSASLSHVWDNVDSNPLLPTQIEDELGFNLTATPLEDGPTLSSVIDFGWNRYDDLSLKSDLSTLLAVSITESEGVLPYMVSSKVADQIDYVLGSHVRTMTFSQGVGLSVDAFYLFLQLTQERRVDVIADAELSSNADVSLRFRPETALHEASITFRNDEDDFDLTTALYIRFTDNLDLTFDGSVSWDRNDTSDVSFGWGITVSGNIELPIPFLRTKGRIEGRAFIDMDQDGILSAADIPASEIVVAANQREVSTNRDGAFRFPPFYPGEYVLTQSELPLGAEAAAPLTVALEAGQTVFVDIPLTPVVVVTGAVFDDANRNGLRDATDTGFPEVRIFIEREDGEIHDAYTDLDGSFAISDVRPGNYTLTIDSQTLPDRFEFTTSAQRTIELRADTDVHVLFGGFVREREVVITFQPPTADFVYEPAEPSAGTLVVFDGSFSFDFDGFIISFAWDFDTDGEIDATGETASWTFTSPGRYDVALTVLDDAGNSDTVVQSVQVGGEAQPVQPQQDDSESSVQPPVADFSYMPASPRAGETVVFNGMSSTDFDGLITAYAWDFNTDGQTDSQAALTEFVFADSGSYLVSLTVTDNAGNRDTTATTIAVTGESGAEDSAAAIASLPIASIHVTPAEPLAGTLVTFNGTGSLDLDGLVTAFAWDFDADGEIDATAPIAEYIFSAAGTYRISLTVTDDDGNQDQISLSLAVAAPLEDEPIASATLQPPIADFAYMPASPQPGEIILFNATPSSDFDGQITGYAWDFEGDGEIDSVAAVVDHVFDAPGYYDVTLTVTDDAGNQDTRVIRLQVGDAVEIPSEEPPTASPSTLQPPIADFAFAPVEPISGQTIAFDASTSADFDGEIVAYAWDFDEDGETDATAIEAEYAFQTAGTYPVALTVTDDGGSTDTLTLEVVVLDTAGQSPLAAPPLADFTFVPASPEPVQTVSFSALASMDTDGEIVAYAWDFDGDGALDADTATADYIYQTIGEFSVTLTVTDDSGNTDAITRTVEVALPTGAQVPTPGTSLQPPVADFSYMPAAPRAGELVMFNASTSADFDGEIIGYSWDLDGDGQPDSTEVIFVHVFSELGSYSISLTVMDDGGNTDTLSIPIEVE